MKLSRKEKIISVASRRQADFTIVLENVHDPHNISAVLRTCDAAGVSEIFVLNTEPHLTPQRFRIGSKTSGGANKWVTVHFYDNPALCISHLKEKYDKVLAATPDEGAVSIWDLDLTGSLAIVFGNEKDGISRETLSLCEGHCIIPMVGMCQSLNISVACAITLYEMYRQRNQAGMYEPKSDSDNQALLEKYLETGIGENSLS